MEKRTTLIRGTLLENLLEVNTSGVLSDAAIQRSYNRLVTNLKTPTKRGFILKTCTCPECNTNLSRRMIQEIEHGSMSLTTHWRFFYYYCLKCGYEWGEWV